jgi:electron transfer flavoprotein beta subunit
LNIVVCVKPVPDPAKYSLITIDPKTKRLVREGIPTIVNPSDKNALEFALSIRDALGGKVSVISMAPLFSQDKIKECLAMGADEAFLISDRAFAGSDTWATSYILSQAIKAAGLEPDLILAGNESADGATSHVPSQLAEWMNRSHVANVLSIEASENGLIVKRKVETGYIEYSVTYPAVIAVARGSNSPRIVTAMGIIKSKNKKLEVLTRDNIELDDAFIGLDGSPTKAGEIIAPDMSRPATKIEGSTDEVAAQILGLIRKSGISY